ncbi:MAG: Gfo/Idh/MocA family oxidoreductase [candidate division WOR-3 bacterium]|nr:MAG: Gfo/Idh/MocA family oxidoreductase [candidate division WOR-3 bacterium]
MAENVEHTIRESSAQYATLDQRTPARIGVVGMGGWGKNLVRNFAQLGVLRAVCDVNSSSVRSCRVTYPNINCTESLDDILNDPEINGVVVATPAKSHYELSKKVLAAKRHLFVEKPLALKVEEAEELIKLAEDNERVIMVGHVLRYHPAMNKLKELVDNGELGKIQYIYSNRLNIGKIRDAENILWSFAPHDISVILYLLNEQPSSLSAIGGTYVQKGIADVTLTTMDFPSGVQCHIFVSWLHPYKEQKLVVVGDRKMAVFDDLTTEKLFLYPHKIEWQNRAPIARKADAEVVPVQMEEPLRLECQHFIECIENGWTPYTDGQEGLNVLTFLYSAQNSLNNNGLKVTFDTKKSARALREDVSVHPTAIVADKARIGRGSKIWNNAQVQAGAQIGENCIIGHNCFVGSKARLGNGVKLESNIDVWDLVTLEDYVFVGPSAAFTNDINPRARYPKRLYPEFGKWVPTLVKEGASIGANSTIICGVTIGRCALVGAGAVVKHNVPDYAIVAGVPAKHIGWVCECGNKLTFGDNGAVCRKCSRRYTKQEERVVEIK